MAIVKNELNTGKDLKKYVDNYMKMSKNKEYRFQGCHKRINIVTESWAHTDVRPHKKYQGKCRGIPAGENEKENGMTGRNEGFTL